MRQEGEELRWEEPMGEWVPREGEEPMGEWVRRAGEEMRGEWLGEVPRGDTTGCLIG